MYIDFHIHYLPELVSEAQIIEEMDRHGIEKSVVLATPDHPRYNQLKLTGHNNLVMELAARHPDRLVPAAYIDPRSVMDRADRDRTVS